MSNKIQDSINKSHVQVTLISWYLVKKYILHSRVSQAFRPWTPRCVSVSSWTPVLCCTNFSTQRPQKNTNRKWAHCFIVQNW